MDSGFLFRAFIFLAAACVVVPLTSRFKLGAVLGYLAAGVLIGPFGFGLLGNAEEIMHFAEFGVIMMLFVIGLEMEPAVLWRMRTSILGLGGLQVLLSTAAFTGLGILFGYGWQLSLAGGMALSLSSTALVLQMLEERNLMQTSVGETSFAVLLFQDIAVIPILVIMPLLADGHSEQTRSGMEGLLHAFKVALVIGGVVLGGRYATPYLFLTIAKTRLREVFTATSLALVVGITLLMQQVGVSPALGAFVAGVVLASSPYKHTLEADIEPFKGLLLGLFFISIGMEMNFQTLVEKPGLVLGVVGILLAVKIPLLYLLARLFGLARMHTIGFAVALSQGGEFAFVLFQYATGLGVLGSEQAGTLALAVALSMATTPVLMILYRQFITPRFLQEAPEGDFDRITELNPVIIAGYGRFGQIIGRFMTGQGVKVTVLEKDAEQIETLRRFGVKGYFGDASRIDLLRSAGASQAKILVVAVDDAEVCLRIVEMAKENFPRLKIFARARNRRHAYELHKAGVDYFRRETFDASLALAQEAMVFLGFDRRVMRRKAIRFRKHDEQTLRRSFEFFEQEPELISFSRQARDELERILQEDVVIRPLRRGYEDVGK